MLIDTDFPGGNIVVEAIDGDRVRLRQDRRDTPDWWFYWAFRVREAAGRTVTFDFTDGRVLPAFGPSISTDGGASWAWQDTEPAERTGFTYRFGPDEQDVRFSMTIPYFDADLQAFLAPRRGRAGLEVHALGHTGQGRVLEWLRLGRLDGRETCRIAIACRHHCCESLASYVLEGLMAAVLDGDERTAWLREHVEFHVLPMVDKDGLEAGDQGKGRQGHDHGRDYHGPHRYPETAAWKSHTEQMAADGRLKLAMDLHCPGLFGPLHEVIHFVGSQDPVLWERVNRLSAVLEAVQRGPLRYRMADNLPWGKDWNTMTGPPGSFGRWAATLPGVYWGGGLEFPYANAGGQIVTVDGARAFGTDLAGALDQWLREDPEVLD